MEKKDHGIAKTIWKKKDKIWGLNLSDLKTYYQAAITKAKWQWSKDRTLGNETE